MAVKAANGGGFLGNMFWKNQSWKIWLNINIYAFIDHFRFILIY